MGYGLWDMGYGICKLNIANWEHFYESPHQMAGSFSDKLLKSWLKWQRNQIRLPIFCISYGLRQNLLGLADKLEFLIANTELLSGS